MCVCVCVFVVLLRHRWSQYIVFNIVKYTLCDHLQFPNTFHRNRVGETRRLRLRLFGAAAQSVHCNSTPTHYVIYLFFGYSLRIKSCCHFAAVQNERQPRNTATIRPENLADMDHERVIREAAVAVGVFGYENIHVFIIIKITFKYCHIITLNPRTYM